MQYRAAIGKEDGCNVGRASSPLSLLPKWRENDPSLASALRGTQNHTWRCCNSNITLTLQTNQTSNLCVNQVDRQVSNPAIIKIVITMYNVFYCHKVSHPGIPRVHLTWAYRQSFWVIQDLSGSARSYALYSRLTFILVHYKNTS